MRPVGVGYEDVAVSPVGDLAVGGQTERWRYTLDARTDGDDRDPDQCDEDGTDEERLGERRTSEEGEVVRSDPRGATFRGLDHHGRCRVRVVRASASSR